ncbi:MAG: hypothetical protein ATN36_07725 [Epulopiscium sp. Nele67-Bin005]|nr:MAG: hypothetical protein ATN36_07725 [Epulopiscium sp. Nele67-Bin005]
MLNFIFTKQNLTPSLIKEFTKRDVEPNDLIFTEITPEKINELKNNPRLTSNSDHIFMPYYFGLFNDIEISFDYYLYTETSFDINKTYHLCKFDPNSPYMSYIYNGLQHQNGVEDRTYYLNDDVENEDIQAIITYYIDGEKYSIMNYLGNKTFIVYLENEYTLPVNNKYRDVPKTKCDTMVIYGQDVEPDELFEIVDYLDYRIYQAHDINNFPVFGISTLIHLARKRFTFNQPLYGEHISLYSFIADQALVIKVNSLFAQICVYRKDENEGFFNENTAELLEENIHLVGFELDAYIHKIYSGLNKEGLLDL